LKFFDEAEPNISLFGGKGSNLIKLAQSGIRIPSGLIITTEAYKGFIQASEYNTEINEMLESTVNLKDIMSFSRKIRDLIILSHIPKPLKREIESGFIKLVETSGQNLAFAVRSSTTIEDSIKFSFAGQTETYLYNITVEDIYKSIKKCWASLFSPQALLYLFQIKQTDLFLNLQGLKMAVIIQKMVNSSVSGVLFTSNVITNDNNQMMINSTWGLGETIANNTVIPDMFIINKKKFEIVEKVLGEKEKTAIQNPLGSLTTLIDTDPSLRKKFSLTEKQISDLYYLGLKLEDIFKCPQDIEWAIEDDISYILQSRPITTIDA
jgi:pyruvate,water dikinase